MKIDAANCTHLTYCSNIHAGETWGQVRANLSEFLPPIKAELAPDQAFGIGLRLSAIAAEELAAEQALAEFKSFLAENDFYVFTINGFPYGEFHGTPVKENVYLPDWRDPARLTYTDTLANILADILPEGVDGSISTVPGAFKPSIQNDQDIAAMAENILRHAAHLVMLKAKTGKTINLAIEPEPCCFIETIDEAVSFFSGHIFSAAACERFATLTGLDVTASEIALRQHVTLCLDLCHSAVEFEEADQVLRKLRDAGINIGKLQISAGLRFAPVDGHTIELLRPFDDEVYLHQTIAKTADGLTRYTDLSEAFAAYADGGNAEEWRVHFHVPIFLDDLGEFATTQNFIREMLTLHLNEPISPHLEVETYTWDVLPAEFRNVDVIAAVVRELDWVKRQLNDDRK